MKLFSGGTEFLCSPICFDKGSKSKCSEQVRYEQILLLYFFYFSTPSHTSETRVVKAFKCRYKFYSSLKKQVKISLEYLCILERGRGP